MSQSPYKFPDSYTRDKDIFFGCERKVEGCLHFAEIASFGLLILYRKGVVKHGQLSA